MPCLLGSKCEFQTVELEYEPQLDGHMKYAHGDTEEHYRAGPDLIRQHDSIMVSVVYLNRK